MSSHVRPLLRGLTERTPRLRAGLAGLRRGVERLRHSLAARYPAVIRPQPHNLTVAVTARCNLRCEGCRYGRDFMPGAQLPLRLVKRLLDDAADAGFEQVRLYGGEPLLHPDLPAMVAHGLARRLDVYVTTNAVLLEKRIDELHAAGLRHLTVGFYGVDEAYDAYAGRRGAFAAVERGIAAVRARYGESIRLRLNWLLMRPTCSVAALDDTLAFARRYRAPIQVDLIHYSLPYFSEGTDRRLQFGVADLPAIEAVVEGLLEARRAEPGLVEHSEEGLRSIPSWLLLRSRMRVPCDKYRMIWVGADGTVQLCYVTFRLGNLYESRLRSLLFTAAHADAARAAFRLDCPNCHCGYDDRILKHAPSARRFGAGLASPVVAPRPTGALA